MSYVIARTKEGQTEILMDQGRQDGSGEFRSPHSEGLNLPKEYKYRFLALKEMYMQENEDPGWIYEVRQYLR